jgi:hypothetical protein
VSAPGQHESQDITQIVAGIGQQCQRIRQEPENSFKDDKPDVQTNADAKGSIVTKGTMFIVVYHIGFI